ncbi:hypothetical protein KAT08_01350 [Candidatus Babeliales bacterium]|nr:hypothetical protein [Candidatus Babeliales bacterium]
MLTEQIDFLGILFELTLFYLLVVSVYKLIKTYLLPILYSEINIIEKKKKDLEDKDSLLDKSKVKLKENIEDQKEKFLLLEKKVDLWKQSMLQENEDAKEQNISLLEKVKIKRKKQETILSLINLQKIVVPSSIQLAYNESQEKYGGNKGLELLSELISVIKPSKR